MAKITSMSIDEHDRIVSILLGLSHALNIAFFTALAECGEAAPKLATMSSTTFDAQLLVSAAVARDNPHLYFEIQKLNPHGLDPLRDLAKSIQRITEIVETGDEEAFVRLMQRGREYLSGNS